MTCAACCWSWRCRRQHHISHKSSKTVQFTYLWIRASGIHTNLFPSLNKAMVQLCPGWKRKPYVCTHNDVKAVSVWKDLEHTRLVVSILILSSISVNWFPILKLGKASGNWRSYWQKAQHYGGLLKPWSSLHCISSNGSNETKSIGEVVTWKVSLNSTGFLYKCPWIPPPVLSHINEDRMLVEIWD